MAIVVAAPYSDRRHGVAFGEFESVRYLGLVLFALGLITMNRAEAPLGKQFSVQVAIQEDHKLVTDGPYRHLCHPRYLSIITFNAGFSLVFHSWLALLLVAVLTLVLPWRVHDEEVFLHQESGTDWEAYAKRSWRLIPFVY